MKKRTGRGGISALVRMMESRARERGVAVLTIGAETANARNLAIYLHWRYRTLVHAETEEGELVLYYAKELGETAAPPPGKEGMRCSPSAL